MNYGAHHGIEWVLLTNAITWKIYRIRFGQPISWDEVCCFDIDGLSSRSMDDLAKIHMLSRECTVTVIKDMLSDIFGYDKYTELTSEQQIRGSIDVRESKGRFTHFR